MRPYELQRHARVRRPPSGVDRPPEGALPIELLTVYEWLGPRVARQEYRDPSWELVEDAIRELNGQAWNDLDLCPAAADPETWLCVGGGAGRYIVTGSACGESFPTVARGPSEEGREGVVVGGQVGAYPRHWVVDLDTALRA